MIPQEQLDTCLQVLRSLADNPHLCTALNSGTEYDIMVAASHLTKAIKREERKEAKSWKKEVQMADAVTSGPRNTSIAKIEKSHSVESDFSAKTSTQALRPYCYVCKMPMHSGHDFYPMMCFYCGRQNLAMRNFAADMSGSTAVVTGGRIKIGYQICLKLLRAGARVFATTRFPADAASRFSQEDDFESWSANLSIYALDLRSWSQTIEFADFLTAKLDHLDVLINNAAQTISRPPAFYKHLIDFEKQALALPVHPLLITDRARYCELLGSHDFIENNHPEYKFFPSGMLDKHGQQIDLRHRNSWTEKLCDVPFVDLLEAHAVNCFAPFILLSRLDELLRRNTERPKFVVNVSAVEGQFKPTKRSAHPHTNMAKAALNMITRTSAGEYAKENIFMNSVDTGWITNEFPAPKASVMEASGFETPLDEIDGAARVCHPVFEGIAKRNFIWGKFLKDYREVPW